MQCKYYYKFSALGVLVGVDYMWKHQLCFVMKTMFLDLSILYPVITNYKQLF